MIDGYTREAGVRQLEREVAALMRKAACKLLDEGAERVVITPQELQAFLGRPRFLREKLDKAPEVGVARGLAYTDFGGETLAVETTVMPGAGALELTGQLGDVMKESARAAMSYVRAHADSFGLAPDFHKKLDTHIHVPEAPSRRTPFRRRCAHVQPCQRAHGHPAKAGSGDDGRDHAARPACSL